MYKYNPKHSNLEFSFNTFLKQQRHICVVGLGYVGLPLSCAFGEITHVNGFDICEKKIKQLSQNIDITGEVSSDDLESANIMFGVNPEVISSSSVVIVTIPTPIDNNNHPDLTHLKRASETIGKYIRPGTIVVYESTVYPGVTEEICVPILESNSDLKLNKDFFVGYSPERLSPGDKKRTLKDVVKVVSGSTPEVLSFLADLYGAVVTAGVHRASSIKVAEAAKVIENTQRDLNVALMNELSIIFTKMGIPTLEVIDAAATKWNFMKMTPGLVGGHCIGVDPYYLTYKALQIGYQPDVILAGRRINDGMGEYVATQLIKTLVQSGISLQKAKIGIFGVTFKENVSDIRNSKAIDILKALLAYGIEVHLTDPLASSSECESEYGFHLTPFDEMKDLTAAVVTVGHGEYMYSDISEFADKIAPDSKVIYDLKSLFRYQSKPKDVVYITM